MEEDGSQAAPASDGNGVTLLPRNRVSSTCSSEGMHLQRPRGVSFVATPEMRYFPAPAIPGGVPLTSLPTASAPSGAKQKQAAPTYSVSPANTVYVQGVTRSPAYAYSPTLSPAVDVPSQTILDMPVHAAGADQTPTDEERARTASISSGASSAGPWRTRLRTDSVVGMPQSQWTQTHVPVGSWTAMPPPHTQPVTSAVLAAPQAVNGSMPSSPPESSPTRRGSMDDPMGASIRSRFRTDSGFGFPVAPTAPVTMQNAFIPSAQASPSVHVTTMPQSQQRQLLNLSAATTVISNSSEVPQARPAQVAAPQYFQVLPQQMTQPGRFIQSSSAMPAMMFPTGQMLGQYAGSPVVTLSTATRVAPQQRTTIMLHNLPDGLTRQMLVDILNAEGFAGRYDFVYLPIAFDTMQGLNHAFVNLISPADAERLWNHFDGFSRWAVPCDRACNVAWNDKQQGLAELIERYKNSPVMHPSVPQEWKPLLIQNGQQCDFPAPTQKIKLPKVFKRQGNTTPAAT